MYLSRMASNTGTCSVYHACCAIPLYVPDTCALLLLSSVPHGEPCWRSSHTLGSQVWRSARRQVQHSCVAQGQPLCWARCPCAVIPLPVIPHVYSSMVRLPSRWVCVFPGRDLLPYLLCSYLTPGWLSLPQRLPYIVLPLTSPYV